MSKEVLSYLNMLKLNSIIYDDEIYKELEKEDICDKEYILSDYYLDNLEALLEVNEETKHLDPQVISNILDTLQFIRKNSTDIERINNLIVKLNEAKTDNYPYFYREQYLKRANMYNKKDIENHDVSWFMDNDILKELRYTIMRDHIITVCLIDEDNIETLDDILLCDHFINTVSVITYECPSVLLIVDVKEKINYMLKRIVMKSLRKDNIYDLDALSRYRSHKLIKKMKKGK